MKISPAGCESKSGIQEIMSSKVHTNGDHGYNEFIQEESGLASKILDPTKKDSQNTEFEFVS